MFERSFGVVCLNCDGIGCDDCAKDPRGAGVETWAKRAKTTAFERAEWQARALKAEEALADRIAELERERDEARAEAVRLAELHPRCEAYDDQPGPSCVHWKERAQHAECGEDREARRQLEANEAKLHEVLGWGGALPPNLPVATRATLEVVDRLRRAERERDEALKLAYVGDHRFPDHTYRAKLDELVPKLRQAERERDEARKTCPLLGDRLGSPGIIERAAAVRCLCVEFGPVQPKDSAR